MVAGKKKNAYPDAVHAFRECDFFPPLHTNITDLKHDDMMNSKKKKNTRQDFRLSVKMV